MALLTRSAFADLARVSKPAITKAVGSGHVIVNADSKVDTDNPLNAAYLAEQEKKAIKKSIIEKASVKKKRKPKGDTVSSHPPPQETDDDMYQEALESVSLDIQKKQVDINLKRVQTRRHEVAIAEKKAELIPRDLVRRKFSAFDAALKTHLRDLPRRTAARLHAIAVSEGPRALETALETEISASLARVKAEAKEQALGD